MAREFTTVIGSGQVPHLSASVPYVLPDGEAPVPAARDALNTRTGTGSVVLNPEDFSVSIGIETAAITVSTSATPLPQSPMEYRRALVVHNASSSTVYLGNANVTVANGLILAAGEKIAFDMQGNSNVKLYAIVASSTAEIRIMELA